MKLSSKKRIAREIIIFISTIILAVIIYFMTFLYNNYYINNYNDTITKIIDAKKELSMQNVIIENKQAEIEYFEKELSYNRDHFLDQNDQVYFAIYSFGTILIILYPIRFFIVLLLWCFKTLRQKEN